MAARRLVARGGEAEDLLEDLGDALGRAVADVLGGLAGLLGLAARDHRGLAGGAQALLELVEALQRVVQLGLHGHDALVGRGGPGARGLGGLAGARELGAQELEPRAAVSATWRTSPSSARSVAARSSAAGARSRRSPVSRTVSPSRSTCAPTASRRSRPGVELGLERGGALVDGLEALDEPLRPPPRASRADATRSCCGALVVRLELAPGRGALLAGAGGVLAGRRGGLAGGGGGLTGAERLRLGAVRLPLGDLELATEAGDQLAQLLGVGTAGLLRALGERDGLVDRRAQRADVGQHGAGAAIDRGDALERVLGGGERLLGDAGVLARVRGARAARRASRATACERRRARRATRAAPRARPPRRGRRTSQAPRG